MSFPLLPLIDLRADPSTSVGLTSQSLAHIGSVFAVLTPFDVELGLTHLQQTLGVLATHFDVSSLSSIEDVVALLDAGATKVFVNREQLLLLKTVDNLDHSRFVLSIPTTSSKDIGDELRGESLVGGVLISDPSQLSSTHTWLKETQKAVPIYVNLGENLQRQALEQALQFICIPIIGATTLTTDPEKEPALFGVSELLLRNATSDRPDGLFTTLVTDERGIALGLVYSNKKSVSESLRTGRGVYHSRKRGLWYKGESSGDSQQLVRLSLDCDTDCLKFTVRQEGRGFCHLATATCFGDYSGLAKLQNTLLSRKHSAPEGSYTQRLFNDEQLLRAKILEEANELCEATTKEHIAAEAADVMYFALTKCIAAGVRLEDVERSLDAKSIKVKRRKGDAKGPWAAGFNGSNGNGVPLAESMTSNNAAQQSAPVEAPTPSAIPKGDRIQMRRYHAGKDSDSAIQEALRRPSQKSTEKIMSIVNPIIVDVRSRGDEALLEYTHKFEKATSLKTPVLKAPFARHLMQLSLETIEAIDVSFDNIYKFHAAQKRRKAIKSRDHARSCLFPLHPAD